MTATLNANTYRPKTGEPAAPTFAEPLPKNGGPEENFPGSDYTDDEVAFRRTAAQASGGIVRGGAHMFAKRFGKGARLAF